ncbi:DUF2589 domain-containing protein [Alistipes sp.]|uniref:DUF2589 domain-containing protein n=1 Tax=Alistipes sp. TaxID=1872444 RepID=UPI003AEFBF92
MAFWRKQNSEPQTFTDLIRGLQHAVNSAMEMIETRNIELLGRYFDPAGRPFSRRLNIDSQTSIDIPLISIVNPSSINIKEVEMDFTVQIAAAEIKRKEPQPGFQLGNDTADFCNGLQRSSFEVNFAGGKDHTQMHVKLKFESNPIPEGLSRIIDEYDKTILPAETPPDESRQPTQ